MKIVGTIVEYNPLHNGHIYAINRIKAESKADLLVAVMSGDFTMRGDLSLYDKFTKTKQALMVGIDLVIALPLVHTIQNSDIFAYQSVALLVQAGVCEIWIGSESNNDKLYQEYYAKWQNEENQKTIKEALAQGKSYKEATAKIINLPSNDLLGFSYYKAIKENNYPVTLKTIQRVGSYYNDLKAKDFASSMAIRNDLSLLNKYAPAFLLDDKIREKEKLFTYLKYQILNHSTTELEKYFLVDEGLENKLYSVKNYSSYEEFAQSLASKRYTKSRIQRMLFYVLFNLTKEEINKLKDKPSNYLRILGYSSKGSNYLKELKKHIKLLTNIKEGLDSLLDIEIKVSKILDFIYDSNELRQEQNKPIEITKGEN